MYKAEAENQLPEGSWNTSQQKHLLKCMHGNETASNNLFDDVLRPRPVIIIIPITLGDRNEHPIVRASGER